MADWLPGFNKRIQVTADSSVVDSDLSWFPLTFRIGTSVGKTGVDNTCVFDEVGDNKYKIAVTEADGTTQLYVEIEQWDSTNKVGVLHAGLNGDTLSSSADTDYYLYYDNTASDNTSYVGDVGSRTEVWDSDFAMVQHLNKDPSGTAPQEIDSTSNNHDGSSDGSMTSDDLVDGKVAKAVDFDGSDDDINLGVINPGDYLTVESLVYCHSINTADANQLLTSDGDSGGDRKWQFRITTGSKVNLIPFNTSGGYASEEGTTTLSTSTWYYLVGTWDGTTVRVYVNGAEDGSGSSLSGTLATGTTDPVYIARMGGTSHPNWLNAISDENRVSGIARSAAYIKANYNNLFDTLLTYGAEENAPTGNSLFFGMNF